jgi:anti-sigma B factor antagonist
VADTYTIGQERAAGGAATLLRLSGELDINARDDLRHAIVGALDDGAEDLVLDMAEVTFIDSEALGALIDGYNAARTRAAGFRLINATGVVKRVLTVSGAADLFGS